MWSVNASVGSGIVTEQLKASSMAGVHTTASGVRKKVAGLRMAV